MDRYLVSCCAVLALLSGCAGSEGPAGPTGPSGPAGAPCEVTATGDGTRTITCPGSEPVTVADGQPGSSCSVTGAGTPVRVISCGDGTSVTVSDGAPCGAVDNGDGTKTLTCPGSDPVVVRDGTRCSVVDNQDGTSILSCSDGSRTVLAAPLDTSLQPWDELPGAVVAVAAVGGAGNADGTFAPGDRLAVTFTVRTAAGRLIPLRDVDSLGAWFAGPTSGYQHVLPAARDAVLYDGVKAAATLNDDGSSTFRFPDPIPAAFGAPLFDTARFSDGEASGPLTPGTYTVGLAAWKGYSVAGRAVTDASSTSSDVRLGGAPALAPRQVVGDANCATCHGGLRVHGGAFRGVALCLTCHTAGAEDPDSADVGDATPVTIEAGVMLHKLHAGANLPSVQGLTTDALGERVYGVGTPYVVGTRDFSAVQFPVFPNVVIAMPRDAGYSRLPAASKSKEDLVRRGVTDCGACHGDPDGAGPLTAPPEGGNAFAAPTRRACGSCHDDLDYARPYTANNQTMPANTTDTTCGICHPQAALQGAHRHPVTDPAVAPEVAVAITGLSGATGASGQFLPGDAISLSFRLKDAAGADVPLTAFDNFTAGLVGPTENRQVVFPGQPGSPFDFLGRLSSVSTVNKGTMGKVQPGGPLVGETLTVEFTSAAAFTVTGTASGALAAGALPASVGTNPSGSSITNVVLTPAAVAQSITVAFTGPTTYVVTGAESGAMGGGTLSASASTTQRFTSTDGSVTFNVIVGTTSPAAGNTFSLAVVKGGAANPVLFAIMGGRTAFAPGDRFYYEVVAPASPYTVALHMDLSLEYLGDADGTAGQVLTAANLPVRLGRQVLLERTATPGSVTGLSAPSTAMGRVLLPTSRDPGLFPGDYLVVDDGTGSEEYVRVSAVDAASGRLTLSTPLRYAHAAGATVQEVTLTFRQEGPAGAYLLSPASGTVTLNAAGTAGNAFVLSYRTDARFGWKRRVGDAAAPSYSAPLAEAVGLDETWGDWRGKPLVDGTYTVAAWGFQIVEHRSGGSGAPEWQTYRATTRAATMPLLYGPTAPGLVPYTGIVDAEARCNGCHGDLTFHGGSRRGADGCLICHATPGPAVAFRSLLHGVHQVGFPAMPNGAASCVSCHGAADAGAPSDRSHPTAQGRPALDWTVACGGCHAATAAQAHFETMTGASSGFEACATCHGPGRELAVGQVHRAR